MCGIAGRIGRPIDKTWDQRLLRRLGIQNESRGTDAAGAFFVWPDGRWMARKAAIPMRHFLRSDHVLSCYFDQALAVVLHTRQATSNNAREDECAHPFWHRGVIAVHNGVISNPEVAYPKKKAPKVDSMAIARILGDEGYTGLEKLHGSASIVWYDNLKGHVGIYTNTGSLHMIEANGCMYFASESRMLPGGEGITPYFFKEKVYYFVGLDGETQLTAEDHPLTHNNYTYTTTPGITFEDWSSRHRGPSIRYEPKPEEKKKEEVVEKTPEPISLGVDGAESCAKCQQITKHRYYATGKRFEKIYAGCETCHSLQDV